MKKFFQTYGTLLIVSGIVVFFDQITKSWVRTNLHKGEILFNGAWGVDYARIIHWQNTGAAFGMFQKLGGFFTILAVIVAVGILYYYPRVPKDAWLLHIALGMQFGGAIGNLIDRLFVGHVTDFISVGNFAVFNIADASITIGTALLAYCIWTQDKKEKQAAENASGEEDLDTGDIAQEPISEEVGSE